jgi:hypothetical protein
MHNLFNKDLVFLHDLIEKERFLFMGNTKIEKAEYLYCISLFKHKMLYDIQADDSPRVFDVANEQYL